MGRAGRPNGNKTGFDPLRELEEEGLPRGWEAYWQGERGEISEGKRYASAQAGTPPPFPRYLPEIRNKQEMRNILLYLSEHATSPSGSTIVPIFPTRGKGPRYKATREAVAAAAWDTPAARKLSLLYDHWKESIGESNYQIACSSAGRVGVIRAWSDYVGGNKHAFEDILGATESELLPILHAPMPREKYQIVVSGLSKADYATLSFADNKNAEWDLLPLEDGLP